MTRVEVLVHEFVEYIPNTLSEGVLYISIPFATTAHLCCCGCRSEIVNPLGPTDWKLIFDGETISLSPSIGNWSYDCQSHYLIDRNRVHWGRAWSPARIDDRRAKDLLAKNIHYSEQVQRGAANRHSRRATRHAEPGSLLDRLWRVLRRDQTTGD